MNLIIVITFNENFKNSKGSKPTAKISEFELCISLTVKHVEE